MKSLGQILTAYREKAKLTVDQLAKKTAIAPKYIQALEAERFGELPAAPLVKGYLHLIAQEIGLDAETALALWRRDVEPAARQPHKRTHAWPTREFFLSPRFLSLSAFLAIFFLALSLVSWQWWRLSQPPQLTVTGPNNWVETTSPVTVTGRTSPDNTVTINTELVSLNPQGEFVYELALPPGERTVVITAEDGRGRRSEIIQFITITP